jgi:hypothetical protein
LAPRCLNWRGFCCLPFPSPSWCNKSES